jgi:hypothetical protein
MKYNGRDGRFSSALLVLSFCGEAFTEPMAGLVSFGGLDHAGEVGVGRGSRLQGEGAETAEFSRVKSAVLAQRIQALVDLIKSGIHAPELPIYIHLHSLLLVVKRDQQILY